MLDKRIINYAVMKVFTFGFFKNRLPFAFCSLF